jgi:NADH dehydrogenase
MDLLQENGHSVSVLTRQSKRPLVIKAGIVQGDLLDPATYSRELKHADAIIHMAAVTHTNTPELYGKVNAEGTRLLLEAAVGEEFAGRFLFVSTRAVGEECGSYGASKARAEELVRLSPLEWTIVRPAEVYGASGREAISSLISMAQKSHVIPIPGWGQDRLAPVYIDDVLDGMVQALRCAHAVRKTYTLAGPEEMTYSELVERFLHLFDRKATTLPVPYAVLRAIACGCDLLRWSNPPIVTDQVERLRCFKSSDIAAAVQDLGYCPRCIEVGVQDHLADEITNRP